MVGLKIKKKIKRKVLYGLAKNQQDTINVLCQRLATMQQKLDYFKTLVEEFRVEQQNKAMAMMGTIPPVLPEMKPLDLQEALRKDSEKAYMHKEALEEYEKYCERETNP